MNFDKCDLFIVPVSRSGKWQAQMWYPIWGKELHLGNYEQEEHAAQIHDIATLKLKGADSSTNFPCNLYQEQLQQLKEVYFGYTQSYCC